MSEETKTALMETSGGESLAIFHLSVVAGKSQFVAPTDLTIVLLGILMTPMIAPTCPSLLTTKSNDAGRGKNGLPHQHQNRFQHLKEILAMGQKPLPIGP